jgi:hypothetical protein
MSTIDTSPEALRALAEEVGDNSDNCSRPCGGTNGKCICNAVYNTLRALAERAAPAPARKFALGDYVTKLKGSSWTGHVVGFYSTALTPVGYAVESENEPGSVQIYPEAALRGVGEPVAPLDALAVPSPAVDLVETVARALAGGTSPEQMEANPDEAEWAREQAKAALAAISMAGYAVVPMSRHPNPVDWRYWEGRYRDEAAKVERLTRERDEALQEVEYLKEEHTRIRDDAISWKARAEAAEAEAARLREALEEITDCAQAGTLAVGMDQMIVRARAALATKEAGHE